MKVDITQAQYWIPIVGGFVVPLAVALLTKIHASAPVRSGVAILCLGLTALGTYLLDTGTSHTWKGAASAFILALFSAASSRLTITGGLDSKIQVLTPKFGFGGYPTVGEDLPNAA